jgi:hypothetical protein
MADKQVLYKVDINLGDAVNKLAELEVQLKDISDGIKDKSAELKEAQDEVISKTEQGIVVSEDERAHILTLQKELVVLKEQRKAVSKEIREQSRQVQNAIVQDNKYAGTLKGLCAQLSIAKDELRAMQMTDPKFAEKASEVGKLNDKIKEMEAAYGVFTRNVGNYGMVAAQTRERIAELVKELAQLSASGKENSTEFQAAKAQLDAYSNQLAQSGQKSVETYSMGVIGLVAGLSSLSRMMGTDSEQAKILQAGISKLQIAVTALAAVTRIYNTLQKQGTIQKIASNLQIKLGTAALVNETKATSGNTVAKFAATVAQKALNAAMRANPIILLISAIIALGTALVALTKWLSSSTSAQKAATEAQKEYEKQTRNTEVTLAANAANEIARATKINALYNEQRRTALKNNATKEELAKIEQKREETLLANEVQFAAERKKTMQMQTAQALANYRVQVASLEDLIRRKGADNRKTLEQQKVMQDAYRTYTDIMNSYNSVVAAIDKALTQQIENEYNKRNEAAEKAFDKQNKLLSQKQKNQQEYLKRLSTYEYNYALSAEENAEAQFQYQLEYNRKAFQMTLNHQLATLNLQRKYGKINEDEYKLQRENLVIQQQNYDMQELAEVEKHRKTLLDAAIQTAGGKNLDDQLEDMRAKYKVALKAIIEDEHLSDEEKNYYKRKLLEKQIAEERSIRLADRDNTDKELEDKVKAAYSDDMRQFSLNEDEKLDYEIDILNDIIAARKQAGLDTYKQEQQLLQLEAKARELSLSKEMQLEWKNARERYLTQKEFLEQELELETLTAEHRAALEEELADLNVEENNRRLESFQNYAEQVMGIAVSINDLMNNLSDARTRKAESDNAKQKKDLEKRLQAGLISQKQYDKETAKADEELANKKAKIEREQAIREKALSAMQIAINTAAAIMKIWAEVPKMDFGVSTGVLTAIAAATGAAQLAAVLSQPLPAAREGGLVKGATHEQGGVLVNTEGDERIISAAPSRAFPELLNLISYIGKHGGVPDTGYAARYYAEGVGASAGAEIDYDLLADKVGDKFREAVAGLQIYTAIDDVRRGDKEYTKIVNSAKL